MGFKFTNLVGYILPKEKAQRLYEDHKDKEFFNDLVEFMISGRCLICQMIINMEADVSIARHITESIRDEYAMSVRVNMIHCSDSIVSGERECSIFFGNKE